MPSHERIQSTIDDGNGFSTEVSGGPVRRFASSVDQTAAPAESRIAVGVLSDLRHADELGVPAGGGRFHRSSGKVRQVRYFHGDSGLPLSVGLQAGNLFGTRVVRGSPGPYRPCPPLLLVAGIALVQFQDPLGQGEQWRLTRKAWSGLTGALKPLMANASFQLSRRGILLDTDGALVNSEPRLRAAEGPLFAEKGVVVGPCPACSPS